jgi:Insect cuticle protein
MSSTNGSVHFRYETGNNIIAEESGYLKDFSEDNPNGVLVQQGSYSYEAPDGQLISVQYTADERGFRVQSDSLPTPPPIPAEIQKGLDLIYEGIRINAERAAREEKEGKNKA